MTKQIIAEINCDTQEMTITECEETLDEIQTRLERASQIATAQADAEEKAIAKAALLAQLGITEEQAKLLLN